MDLRVIFLCVVTAYGKTTEFNPNYKPSVGLESRDTREQTSTVKEGYVQPLDFSTFTQQLVGDQQDERLTFDKAKTAPNFGSDSKKSGAFQLPNSQFAAFPGSIFYNANKVNKTGFVEPAKFPKTTFDKESSSNVYKTNINPSKTPEKIIDQVPKATEDEDEDGDPYYRRVPKVETYRQPSKPHKPKKPYTYGKSSYPAPHRKSSPSDYYSGIISKPKDVEMILPKDKVLFLPMVNGKPKPYDGYRAAPEAESYETFDRDETRETSQQREKRLNEGEIIYGKPKIALSKLHHRQLKRSPAEYYGGIYPYYDYSDAKLSVGGDTDPDVTSRGKKSLPSNQKKKKIFPKKHPQRSRDKQYDPYKYPKETTRRRNKETDASGESSEEVEEEAEEDTEETKGDKPLYKYTYDNSFHIPQLKIKTYPYEKQLKDSEGEGSRRDESYDTEDNVDEYTASYEKYIKTLPSDLEAYFGTPDLTDKFSVEATQNLENNKNCKKIENAQPQQEGSDKAKAEEEAQSQICYICSDPETGDNYEQCSYRSKPKSQKYFFGGTTSFQSNDTAEPTTYRYRRSTFEYPYHIDPYAIEESESKESQESKEADDSSEEYFKKPRKKSKKKYKKQRALGSNYYGKKHPKKRYESYDDSDYEPYYSLDESSSTKKGRAARLEEPPASYDGPKYTYEGPEETYEGPSQPYEGPKETYEGPAEPYEGPINQEYYDTTDERIEDDDEESSNQESQTSAPTTRYNTDNDEPKPKKRQSYYSPPYRPSRYSEEESQESFSPSLGYTSDYRFGPEHFVDEGKPEDSKQNEQVKPTEPPNAEKRGPHKFPPPESRLPAATDKQEKEESIGDVKVFKNGDVCQKKRKEGMICMVCKNEKTAATYEQCQYSTKPKEKYYAYGSQKSYTTKNPTSGKKEEEEDDSDSDQYPEKSDIVEKKILITTQSKVFGYDPTPTPLPLEGLVVAESKNSPRLLSRDSYGDYSGNIETLPEENKQNDTSGDFIESIERIEPRDGIEGLEEYLYEADDSEKKATEEEKRSYKSYDDYFHDLFPEFAKGSDPIPYSDEKEESESEKHLTFDPFSNIRQFHEENADYPEKYTKNEEEEEEEEKDAEASRPEELRLKDKQSQIPPDFFLPYNEDNHKKDLEKALGEFQNKDWSNCKKIVKKKLTCYQCVDKNGVNNEECMYVEASQPISKHLAYHEKKELKPNGQETENKTSEPSTEVIQPEKAEKSLRRFRKAKNSHEELIEVVEPPKDAEYLENSTSKGDFEGIERLPIKEAESEAKVLETTSAIPEQVTFKSKTKKQKRHPKKRNKTRRNETTTERFEKFQKRKFPLKKFTEAEESIMDHKPESESFGLRHPENKHESSAQVNLNTTESSPS